MNLSEHRNEINLFNLRRQEGGQLHPVKGGQFIHFLHSSRKKHITKKTKIYTKMKKRDIVFKIILLLVLLIDPFSSGIFASNDNPTKNKENIKSSQTTISVTVNVSADCEAAQNCSWIICIYDVTGCEEDVEPVECKDYSYGTNTYNFSVNINYSYVRACIMHKPGTSHCTYQHYSPKCKCNPTASSMEFDLDFCVP